jgi:hypothetical protein
MPERDGVGERQRAVGVVAEAVAGKRGRQRAVARELVRRRIDAALQLVHGEAVLLLQCAGVGDELLRGAHFAAAGRRIGVAEEEVARERHGVAQLAAEERVHRHAELLPHDVEAGELDRRVELRPVVVEARGRVADREAHRLQAEHVVPAQVIGQRGERARGVLAAAAHLAQPHVAVGGLDLDHGAHEAAPVRAVAVQQGRFERHGDRRGADGGDRGGGHWGSGIREGR